MATQTAVAERISPIELTKARFVRQNPKEVESRTNALIQSGKSAVETTEKEMSRTAEKTDTELARLKNLLITLDSPMEAVARQKTQTQIYAIFQKAKRFHKEKTSKRYSLLREIEVREAFSKAMGELLLLYPFISLQDIPWVKKGKLQIVPIHSAAARFCTWDTLVEFLWEGKRGQIGLVNSQDSYVWNNMTDSDFPSFLLWKIMQQIKKVNREENGRRKNEKQHQYSFSGIIPQEVKAVMKKAEPVFKKAGGFLLMLADVASCKVREVPISADPLIVGWHPHCPDYFWLVAMFDVTPVEELIFNKALKNSYDARFEE